MSVPKKEGTGIDHCDAVCRNQQKSPESQRQKQIDRLTEDFGVKGLGLAKKRRGGKEKGGSTEPGNSRPRAIFSF